MPAVPAIRSVTVGTFTPPVTTTKICYGSSQGPLTYAGVIAALKPNRLRTYSGTHTQAQVAAITIAQTYTTKVGSVSALVAMSDSTSAGFAAARQSYRNEGLNLPDIAPGGLLPEYGLWHEPYDEVQAGTFTAAQYAGAVVNFKTHVIDWLNLPAQGRTHQVLHVPVMQGFVLAQNRAVLDTLYTPAVLASVDIIGTDNYKATQQAPWAAYAKAAGKPWGIYEWGWLAGGTTSQASDPTSLSFMQANQPGLASLDPPPVDVLWFDNNGTLITGLPTHDAQDYWANVSSL